MNFKTFTIIVTGVVILNACSSDNTEVKYEYYESGQVNSISHWKDGKINGVVKEFHENGNISAEGVFKNNLEVGRFTFYDESGIKTQTLDYDDMGNIDDFLYYDSLGNNVKNLELSIPFLNIEKEKIILGENYNVEIGIGNRFADSVCVIVSNLDEEDSLLRRGDTLKNENYFFRQSFKPQKSGSHFFYYKVIQIHSTDSIIDIRRTVEKVTFQVESTS